MDNNIPSPPYLVRLDVTSFRGISIGAQHYYGKLFIHNKSNRMGYNAPKHPLDHTEITQPLTLKMAKALDEKDGGECYVRSAERGSSTTRFDRRKEVLAAAVAFFEENFDKTSDILVIEKEIKVPNENYYETHLEVLSGPDHLKDALSVAGSRYSDILKLHISEIPEQDNTNGMEVS